MPKSTTDLADESPQIHMEIFAVLSPLRPDFEHISTTHTRPDQVQSVATAQKDRRKRPRRSPKVQTLAVICNADHGRSEEFLLRITNDC